MSAIEVRVYSRADPTVVVVLEQSRRRGWTDALNDVGGGTFSVSALDPKLLANPTILDYGNIVRLALDSEEVFAFVIEKKAAPRVTDDEDAGRWITVSGRGVLSITEAAVVYPAGGLDGPGERSWVDSTAGTIMGDLFDEARARDALAGVSRDFSDATDSSGAAYETHLDMAEQAGTDLLAIALRHVELAVDVQMTVALDLRYYNSRGTDRSVGVNPVVLRVAEQSKALDTAGDGVIKNTLLVQGPSGFSDRQDAGSAATYGRREGFLAMGNAKTADQLNRAADRLLTSQAAPNESIKIVAAWRAGSLPYVDYDLGDWILAPNSAGEITSQRVRGITVEEDDDGNIKVTPELSGVRKEYEARVGRWLKSIGDGSLGGTAAAASSPTPTSGTTDAIGSAIAEHEASHPHPDELRDLADVDVAGVADEDLLGFETGSGKWEPKAGQLRASAPWNPGLLADGAITSTDVTCVGARVGDPAVAAFSQITVGEWMVYATVLEDDEVHVDLWNRTGAGHDLPAGTVRVVVFAA